MHAHAVPCAGRHNLHHTVVALVVVPCQTLAHVAREDTLAYSCAENVHKTQNCARIVKNMALVVDTESN